MRETAWRAALLAIALVACGAQLDRETLRLPPLTALVPGPFRSFALYPVVANALQKAPRAALAAARTLVLRRPVPSESLSSYGVAALANGRQYQALQALSLASGRGWRDPVVQKITASSAFQNGDMAGTADRVGALWLTDSVDDEVSTLTSRLLENPKGRAEFVRRVAGASLVTAKLFVWGAQGLQSRVLGATAADLRRAGAAIDCSAVSVLAEHMVRDENVAGAQALWENACGNGSKTTVRFAFRPLNAQNSGPMDWSYPGSPGLDTDSVPDNGQVALRYDNKNDIATVLAMISARLSAGKHSVALLAPSGDAQNGLQMRLRCVGRAGKSSDMSVFPLPGSGNATFSVPNDCSIQIITVESRRGHGSFAGLRLD